MCDANAIRSSAFAASRLSPATLAETPSRRSPHNMDWVAQAALAARASPLRCRETPRRYVDADVEVVVDHRRRSRGFQPQANGRRFGGYQQRGGNLHPVDCAIFAAAPPATAPNYRFCSWRNVCIMAHLPRNRCGADVLPDPSSRFCVRPGPAVTSPAFAAGISQEDTDAT